MTSLSNLCTNVSIEKPLTIFWFRRDLRLFDNTALFFALSQNEAVLPLFIFDEAINSELAINDGRITFIYNTLNTLKLQLEKIGSSLLLIKGNVISIFEKLIAQYPIKAVYANHDYEPYSLMRDSEVATLLSKSGVQFFSFKDQVVFEKLEICKHDGNPYTVFTPYMRRWKSELKTKHLEQYNLEPYYANFVKAKPFQLFGLHEIGFERCDIFIVAAQIEISTIKQYAQLRDFPAADATTRLGIHLRFGTISLRQLAAIALQHSDIYLNELIWREFYMMILWNFPKVVTQSFKSKYDNIPWVNNAQQFAAWCDGTTGYPLVDAGMRQLNQTGYMHNRVRMVVSSFLTKHLLIDWRWGEAYFAAKLLDYELASNNGGWQWAASTGCDAVPYFRIFSPDAQLKRFDPQMKYVKRWIPEFGTAAYPIPMVEHAMARKRAIDTYYYVSTHF